MIKADFEIIYNGGDDKVPRELTAHPVYKTRCCPPEIPLAYQTVVRCEHCGRYWRLGLAAFGESSRFTTQWRRTYLTYFRDLFHRDHQPEEKQVAYQ
jgi:hypothetical protein